METASTSVKGSVPEKETPIDPRLITNAAQQQTPGNKSTNVPCTATPPSNSAKGSPAAVDSNHYPVPPPHKWDTLRTRVVQYSARECGVWLKEVVRRHAPSPFPDIHNVPATVEDECKEPLSNYHEFPQDIVSAVWCKMMEHVDFSCLHIKVTNKLTPKEMGDTVLMSHTFIRTPDRLPPSPFLLFNEEWHPLEILYYMWNHLRKITGAIVLSASIPFGRPNEFNGELAATRSINLRERKDCVLKAVVVAQIHCTLSPDRTPIIQYTSYDLDRIRTTVNGQVQHENRVRNHNVFHLMTDTIMDVPRAARSVTSSYYRLLTKELDNKCVVIEVTLNMARPSKHSHHGRIIYFQLQQILSPVNRVLTVTDNDWFTVGESCVCQGGSTGTVNFNEPVYT